jgi:uncharacterized protein YbjT (DUF2867 family)
LAKVPLRVSYREQADLNVLRNYAVEPVYADYADVNTIKKAMQDVSSALLILPIHEQMAEWGKRVIDCAKKTKLPRLVLLSNLGANEQSANDIPRMHGEIIASLKESGIPYDIVKSAPYFQNLFWNVITIVRNRQFSLPLDNIEIPYIDVQDLSIVFAKLLYETREGNNEYYLTGPQPLSMFRFSRQLSLALGKSIRYVPSPPQAGAQTFRDMGLTRWLSQAIADMYKDYATGNYSQITKDFEKIMGRKPTGISSFLERNISVFTDPTVPAGFLES